MSAVFPARPPAPERVSAAREARSSREPLRIERERAASDEPSEFATNLAAAMHAPAAPRDPVREREPERPERENAHEQRTVTNEREGAAGDDPDAGPAAIATADTTAGATKPDETATAAVANDAPTSRVQKGLDLVDPTLATRVERVIDRMKAEYGHDVTVVETLRPQARQDALFAQGRSAPGAVVTWTRNSNHTKGRAADLMVDGSYAVGVGYERLQRVAREEGLHTLGMRDPGHVELPKHMGERLAAVPTMERGPTIAAATMRAAAAAPVVDAMSRPTPGVPRMAAVATVATVAAPAAVAQVATVAVPGAPGGSGWSSGGGLSGGDGRGASAERRTPLAPAPREASADAVLATLDAASAEIGGAGIPLVDSSTIASRGAQVRAVAGVGGADPLAQMERVADVRDAAASRAPSFVTVKVENGMGGEDRIRLDLRNGMVGATLDVADPALADRIGARVGELRQALERRGLTMDQLRVRGGGSAEAIEAARVAAPTLDRDGGRFSNSTNTSTPQDRPEGDAAHRRDRDAEADRDAQAAARQRSRRPSTPQPGH